MQYWYLSHIENYKIREYRRKLSLAEKNLLDASELCLATSLTPLLKWSKKGIMHSKYIGNDRFGSMNWKGVHNAYVTHIVEENMQGCTVNEGEGCSVIWCTVIKIRVVLL